MWFIYVEKIIENLIWRYEMYDLYVFISIEFIFSYEVFEELLGVNEF